MEANAIPIRHSSRIPFFPELGLVAGTFPDIARKRPKIRQTGDFSVHDLCGSIYGIT